jgi:hypothetical protein
MLLEFDDYEQTLKMMPKFTDQVVSDRVRTSFALRPTASAQDQPCRSNPTHPVPSLVEGQKKGLTHDTLYMILSRI